MTRKMLLIVLIAGLAAALAGGYTMAYFTTKAVAPVNEFTAGTVLIEAGEVVTGDHDEILNWNPGKCTEVRYEITNQGSKCLFLRAKYEARWHLQCETAMVRMQDWPEDYDYRWPGHPWFSYIIHKPTEDKETFYFYAAQTHRVGEVEIWKDGDQLYLEIKLDEGFTMSESHVNVARSEEELTAGPGNGLAFGTWPYTAAHEPAVPTYKYTIDWEEEWDDQDLYIAVHGEVCAEEWVQWVPPLHRDDDNKLLEAVSVEPCDETWRIGDDGYLYYVGQENDNCLQGIEAEETVVLCLQVCLSGPLADNRYRNKKLEIFVTFEAIQCSNNAAQEQGWPFTCDGP